MRMGHSNAMGVPHAAATRLGRITGVLRRLGVARGGNAAVEFAMMAPFLLGLMVPLADLGAYIYDYMEIQLAAQAGGEYAARHGWDPNGIQNAITAAAPSLGLVLTGDSNFNGAGDVLPTSFTPATVQSCGCASGTTITAVTCSNPRPVCAGTGATSGLYYTVGARTVYHTISGFQYPFLASGQTIQATSIVRVQ